MRLMFWRRQDKAPTPKRRREVPPADTGGREARERAEAALREARERRAQQEPLRRWFVVEASENGYGRNVEHIFRGGKK